MTTTTDPHLAETQRVYDEYDAARALWEADRDDLLARARFDRAQQAVQQTREVWRGIGVAAGTRTVGPLTLDNSDETPALVDQHRQEA